MKERDCGRENGTGLVKCLGHKFSRILSCAQQLKGFDHESVCPMTCRGMIGPDGQDVSESKGHNEEDDVRCVVALRKPAALVHRLTPAIQAIADACGI